MRPAWVDQQLFPFDSHFLEVDGAQVHYLDEGQGPVFLALHGNPTWSFLYRHIIDGLKDRFRCIALDYPGFGLSTAPPGYGYTVAEHARVVEGFVTRLGLDGITLMGQDWGGPIGLSVAVRHPERFRALVIGNTFGWPVRGEKTFERFSKLMGSTFPGGVLVKRLDLFTRVFVPGGIKRKSSPGPRRPCTAAPTPPPGRGSRCMCFPGRSWPPTSCCPRWSRGCRAWPTSPP
jgi:haloalkane dehalogenase